MSESFERRLGLLAAAIVEASARRPRLTLLLCLALTVGAVAAALQLDVDADADRLLSSDLSVRRTNLELAEAFPALQNNLIVMVDADDPKDARSAAEELALRLRAQPERYPSVFLPGDGPYYEDFGLFYLDRDELGSVAERIDEAGPLLAALEEKPELPVLLGAFTQVIGSFDGLDSLGDDGRRILEALADTVAASNAGERAPVEWDELLFDDLGGEPDNPQLVFVRPVGDLTQLEPVLRAVEHIRSLGPELGDWPGLRVRVTGDRAVHSEEMLLVVDEAMVAAGASLVLVTLILLACLLSVRLVLNTVVTLLVGLTWTAGMAGVAVGQLNALTTAFAVVYIGLAVDFCIHFGLGYLEQRGLGKERLLALRDTGEEVGSSLMICALTTAIGFYAFIPTAYSGVADMGVISGTGVFLGLMATLTVFPAMITLGLGESRKPGRGGLTSRWSLPKFPARHPRAVCGVGLVLGLGSLASLGFVRFDLSTLNVRDPRVESVQALRELLEDGERSNWTIEVLARNLDEAQEAAAAIEQLDGVRQVYTAASFLPEDQPERLAVFEEMREDLAAPVELSEEESGEGLDRVDAAEFTIAGYAVALDVDAELRGEDGADDPLLQSAERLRRELVVLDRRLREDGAETILDGLEADLFTELPGAVDGIRDALPTRTVAMEDLPDDLKARYMAPDGRARVEVFSSAMLNEPGELARFSDLVHSVRPDAGGAAAGTVALGRAMMGSLQQALLTAVGVIAVLLWWLYRSLPATLVTLTPLMVGTLGTAAVSVLADIPLNFANIIVLPLILGIGVDSGIHLVHRYRLGRGDTAQLLSTSTARAVLFSALTTAASFGTLALSNHLGIASLAQLLTVGIALMLATNGILLPAILALRNR